MAARDIMQAAAGAAGATEANYIEDVFSTYLYTGTGASQTITNGIDLATKGGLVWIKMRNNPFHSAIADTARGASNLLSSGMTGAQVAETNAVTSFNTDGFTVGVDGDTGRVNTLNTSLASWTFRKQPKFFDVVTYTGTGSARTIAHNLGCVPGMIIVKSSSDATNWGVYHKSSGATNYLLLNSTNASTASTNYWNDTSPTSTAFSVGASAITNGSGITYVAYLFADSNSGGFGPAGTDSVVACGSYSGGSGFVNLGWEPQWIMIKNVSDTARYQGDWNIFDNMRGLPVGGGERMVWANSADAEYNGSANGIDISATGFSPFSWMNTGDGPYIYLAIRRGPMKTPTDATKVFAPVVINDSNFITTGFPVDFLLKGRQSASIVNHTAFSRLTGLKYLRTSTTSAEGEATVVKFDYNNGALQELSSDTTINWLFRRAPGFFDVVCYTGTGSATTVAHNLGVVPELVIVKRRSAAEDWIVYAASWGTGSGLRINSSTGAAYSNTNLINPAPTSTVFSVASNDPSVNASGSTYVAYLFATCPGVSKVGSYTGSGTTKQIDCGFAAGARFVLIKNIGGAGDWYVWDSARGIVSGNDPYLLLNSTAAEVTNTDYIDPYSAGFEISSTAPAEINASGGSFVFLAIA